MADIGFRRVISFEDGPDIVVAADGESREVELHIAECSKRLKPNDLVELRKALNDAAAWVAERYDGQEALPSRLRALGAACGAARREPGSGADGERYPTARRGSPQRRAHYERQPLPIEVATGTKGAVARRDHLGNSLGEAPALAGSRRRPRGRSALAE